MKTKENFLEKPKAQSPALYSVSTLVKRLLLLALFCAVFAAAAILIPEKVTYEEIPQGNYTQESSMQLYADINSTVNAKKTTNTAYNATDAGKHPDNVILKLCGDSGNIGVFKPNGVKIGSISLCSYAVTDMDIRLLETGISLESYELYELLGQLEAELTTQ